MKDEFLDEKLVLASGEPFHQHQGFPVDLKIIKRCRTSVECTVFEKMSEMIHYSIRECLMLEDVKKAHLLEVILKNIKTYGFKKESLFKIVDKDGKIYLQYTPQ